MAAPPPGGRLIALARRSLPRALPLVLTMMLAAGSSFALGTPTLVLDIKPGGNDGNPQTLLSVGSNLFCSARTVPNGTEPWVSDGTGAGTVLLKDVCAGACPGIFDNPSQFPTAIRVGPIVYFVANNGTGARLWRTDGTALGTTLVYTGASTVGDLEDVGGTIYFAGVPTGFGTTFLFKSDGTGGGTSQVSNFVNVQGNLTNVDGTLFFVGANGTVGQELWKSNGTLGGTSHVKDLSPGSSYSYFQFLTAVGGTLFCMGTTDLGSGLFRSDGTDPGTFHLKTLTWEPDQFAKGQIVNANGTAFMIASDGVSGMELWKSDGTILGTVLVKDILPGAGDGLAGGSSLVAIGNTVYFAASDGSVGVELWKSDGTAAGTVMVKDIYPGFGNFSSSNPAGLANVDGKLFFRAESSPSSGTQPWVSDGTAGSTLPLGVMAPAGGNCLAENFTKVGNNIFLTGTDGVTGIELWVIDGSVSGVEDGGKGSSHPLTLLQNSPNPMSSRTQISYALPADQQVRLELYDVNGRLVQTLVNQWQPAGPHHVDLSASGLPDGAYFYRLQTESGIEQRKMVLAR